MARTPLVVLTTVGSEADARALVTALLADRLIACGTFLQSARSIYRWEGKVRGEGEVVVLLNTEQSRWDAFCAGLRRGGGGGGRRGGALAPRGGPLGGRGARGGGAAGIRAGARRCPSTGRRPHRPRRAPVPPWAVARSRGAATAGRRGRRRARRR